MRTNLLTITLLLCHTFFLKSQSPFLQSENAYLGKTPPGDTPEVFLEDTHARIYITNDGKTIYCSAVEAAGVEGHENTYFYEYKNNVWEGPTKLFSRYFAPTMTMEDDTLITMKYTSWQSFYSVKNGDSWTSPTLISRSELYYLQQTDLGNYYCGANSLSGSVGSWDLYKADINNGNVTYTNLGIPLNTTNSDVEFFISKDETFMVLGVNEGGPKGRELFISYKKEDGSWSNPKDLGPKINDNTNYKWGPFVSRDNKFLFYSSEPGPYQIMWVRFDNLLDSLRNTNFIPYLKQPIRTQTVKPGALFEYSIPANYIFLDDDGNNTLSYAATLEDGSSLPTWLSFNPENGLFSGTPDSEGDYRIKVTATDPSNATVTTIFDLMVDNNANNRPYVNKDIPDTVFYTGEFFIYEIDKETFKDPDGANTLTITGGLDGGYPLPGWLNYSSISGLLTGKSTEPMELDIVISAIDSAGVKVSEGFKLSIIDEVSGINNFSEPNSPIFYPNPTSNILYINTDEIEDIVNSYGIFTLNGKLLKYSKLENNIIDVSFLKTGVYIIKLNYDTEAICSKIVVN